MVTTTRDLWGIGGNGAINESTSEVARRLNGVYTVEETVRRYYGLQREDMYKRKKLLEYGVKHTPQLEVLGVSEQAFKNLFSDILDEDDFKQGNTCGSNDGTQFESVLASDNE